MQVSAELLAAGRKNVGVLVALKNSARNCRKWRSVKLKFLKMDPSTFFEPGPRAARCAAVPNS